jgi:ATP-dependent DNA ligase
VSPSTPPNAGRRTLRTSPKNCATAAISSFATSVVSSGFGYRCRSYWFDQAFERKNPAAIGLKAAFRGFIEPALASSIAKMPSGERWIHEIKFDGLPSRS